MVVPSEERRKGCVFFKNSDRGNLKFAAETTGFTEKGQRGLQVLQVMICMILDEQ
jgi:hypothetical protein